MSSALAYIFLHFSYYSNWDKKSSYSYQSVQIQEFKSVQFYYIKSDG